MSTVISTTQLASTTSDQNLLRVTFDYGQSYASEDLYLHVMGFSDNGSNSTPTSVLINNNSGNEGLTWSTTATMDDYDVTNLKDGSAMGTDRSWDTGYGVEFLNQGTGLTAEFDVDFSAYDYITVSFARSLGTTGFTLDNIKIEAVPEPSSVALLGLGSLALVTRRKR